MSAATSPLSTFLRLQRHPATLAFTLAVACALSATPMYARHNISTELRYLEEVHAAKQNAQLAAFHAHLAATGRDRARQRAQALQAGKITPDDARKWAERDARALAEAHKGVDAILDEGKAEWDAWVEERRNMYAAPVRKVPVPLASFVGEAEAAELAVKAERDEEAMTWVTMAKWKHPDAEVTHDDD
ncbi:hypothetical protein AMAG_13057 [Allomyces macrogynus ATCC 38327]|uniref:Uncharacterized protein n=1 Tax=Allomyces macrogynus (strain ATCC 38327) TaxID=578462 RepID=A0A0L0T0W2_ALLM3|nr:hypothetical protein AMAG_13057 [Allomyces macrogynus ATCC 38327]|eukprot:KNE68401.1 hypothetical protein AMAG_13057 [Allomyces macrogynus ATCC 38327]